MAGPHLSPRVTVLLACALLFSGTVSFASTTRSQDVNALNALYQGWSSPGGLTKWGTGDPCTAPWFGVTCDSSNVTVTELQVSNTGLKGSISSAIGGLSGLQILDLSNNPLLKGPIPSQIGQLTQLQTLYVGFSGLTGPLPAAIGTLSQLTFLGLNDNNFNGPLPASLGNLQNLTWLDVSDNSFSGLIPVSGPNNQVGLDSIPGIVHLHLQNNSFSGSVPTVFYTLPNVLHVLLHYNKLSGTLQDIPSTNLSKTLTTIRLDYNQNLVGPIPQNYTNFPSLLDFTVKGNFFSEQVPDFSNATNLQILDLSYNNFNPEQFPTWAVSLSNIQTLNLAGINISGTIPAELFDLPDIQSIDLSNNQLSGALTFNTSGTVKTSSDLQSINLQNNSIVGISGSPTLKSTAWNVTILLQQNPICLNPYVNLPLACAGVGSEMFVHPPVSSRCTGESLDVCGGGQYLNWYTCNCSFPLALELRLTAPGFSNLELTAVPLEQNLASNLSLQANQVFVYDMVYEPSLQVDAFVYVFPATGDVLPTDVSDNITQTLRHHLITLPEGPYLLVEGSQTESTKKSALTTGAIIGIAIGATAAFFIVLGSVIFAVYHKRRADRAVMSNPFASWGGGSAEFGEAPKLKGARWFALAELKQYTNNWNEDNLLGVGGYGRVYRGELPDGTLVAIKRATEGSMQGANEFKNEIELLSRVHHRNLVGLVGFCYEGGEQALIYEFMSNGTLSDHLKAREVPLTWEERLHIALASAIGINYLHDHASPPIIHRDIKSANILLNEKMVAKVADFGLSKLAPDEGQKLVHSVNVKGTMGYLDPEYYMTSDLTDKSDVYSFGVVLLELLTARPPIDQGRFVVREFRNALDKGGIEALRPLLDPALQNISAGDLEPYLKIAMACVEEDGASRPTTAEIVKQLQTLDAISKPKGGVRAMDVEGGGKKVKFADDLNPESEQMDLLSIDMQPTGVPPYPYQTAPDSFRYSGAYGVTTTVKPK